ncbi:MAG: PEP-CTERM sorting domain-containing protein [Undibacterium sp.]|nr:PEP-CTERM sorting domain-containing protein [Opitutaceae bacterium]
MKLRPKSKLLLAAALGLAFTAINAHAQLIVNVRERATFTGFVGGTNNGVSNNGGVNLAETVTTGTPVATPFTIVYQPLTGPGNVTLNTGTLNTATFQFTSPVSPANFFSSVQVAIDTDFDNNGTYDLTQNYTLSLSPFTAPNGLSGVNYSIVPQQFFGSVSINGSSYGYASVVSNNSGTLFDGSSTTAAIQFQFLALATPVPEPSTYALFGVLALGGIVALRRRRSSANAAALSLA